MIIYLINIKKMKDIDFMCRIKFNSTQKKDAIKIKGSIYENIY